MNTTDDQHPISQSGGVNIRGGDVRVDGDIVGRDKIIFTDDQSHDVRGLANPFLGLQSFTYAERAKYGGRARDIAIAVAKLTAPDEPQPLLFVTGASGSGKSSFAQAGLLPALVAHYGETTTKWAVFRPAQNPLAGLSDALWRRLGLPALAPERLNAQSFADHVHAHTPERQVNLIVVDQFEELLTQSAPQSRDTLFDILAHLPCFSETHTHIIGTLRADYLPELFDQPDLYEVAKYGVDLRAMSISELAEAIQQPLQAAYPDGQKRFEPELVEKLARDAAEDAAYLPLLQVTLEEIWTRGSLTLGAYSNLTDAIKQRADKVLAFSDYDHSTPAQARIPAEQAAILDLLLDLVDVSANNDAHRDVRRRRPLDELAAQSPERKRLIEDLTKARLLTQTMAAGDETRVEVDLIHETLLTNWEQLRTAIVEKRQQLRQRTRFEQRLRDWASGHSDLLDGVSLAEARALDERGDIALRGKEARAFLAQSNEQSEAEQQQRLDDERRLREEAEARALAERRLRGEIEARQQQSLEDAGRIAAEQKRAARNWRWVAILVILVVIGSAGVGLFFVELHYTTVNEENAHAIAEAKAEAKAVSEHDAAETAKLEAQSQQRIAFSRELAAWAIENLNTNPELSVLLAMQSISRTYTLEGEDALRQALLNSYIKTTLRGHTGKLLSVAYSPNGRLIATASGWTNEHPDDNTARIWDAATGRELKTLHVNAGYVTSVSFSQDGRQLLTTHLGLTNQDDGTARIWDVDTGLERKTITTTARLWGAAYNPLNGKQIVTANNDGTVDIWDMLTGLRVRRLNGKHDSYVLNVAYSPNGRKIATASADGTTRIWDAESGTELLPPLKQGGVVNSAFFSHDGNQIVTAGDDKTARIWDVVTGKQLAIFYGHTQSVSSAIFRNDDQQILTTSSDNTARIWDLTTRRELVILRGHTAGVSRAAYSPVDDETIVTADGDGTGRVWSLSYGRELPTLRGHIGSILSAAFSYDGKQVVTAGADGTARIWDATTGISLNELAGHNGPVNTANFSPNGTQVVTGDDKSARVWDVASSHLITSLISNQGAVKSAVYSNDRKYILTAGADSTARLWDAVTLLSWSMWKAHDRQVQSATFSPKDTYIVTASDDWTAKVWKAGATEKLIATFRGHGGPIFTAVFSPDERYVVTSSNDNSARLWEMASGKQVQIFPHGALVSSAAFSPDGNQIVTSSWDGLARIWNVATGKEIAILRGHTDYVTHAAFSLDGKYIVTASNDGTARIYLARIEDLQALAQTRVSRPLMCEERQTFLHEKDTCP